MGIDQDKISQLNQLRRKAEEVLEKNSHIGSVPTEDIRKLIHELHVHQIELEMQNDELRRTQEELEASRGKYVDLFDFAPIGYFTLNEKGVIQEVNMTGAELLEYNRRDLVKRGFSQIIVPDYQDIFYVYRKQVLENNLRHTCELKLKKKGGSEFFGQMEIVGVVDRQSEVGWLRVSLIDITDRKQGEVEREKLIIELKRKNEELERFAYTISHDLKSPLVTITSFLREISKSIDENEFKNIKSYMGYIHNAADKMRFLLDGLLELSRVGRLINPPEEVFMAELVKDVLEACDGDIKERGANVEVGENLPILFGDKLRLGEVFQNLLENSLKFMGEQSEPRIEFDVRHKNGQCVIFVRDNGIGIDPCYHEKIFGVFDQLDQSFEGSGLGLSMVKAIVDAHGGSVWVESKGVGCGSTFCFTLPMHIN